MRNNIIPTSIAYGLVQGAPDTKKFGTILVDDYGERKASLNRHKTLGEAKKDASFRQDLYRILFSERVPVSPREIDPNTNN